MNKKNLYPAEKVAQVDPITKETIHVFTSITQAAKSININVGLLKFYLDKEVFKGFLWKRI